ncbi:MAG: CBS domain-containing protein [Elusimicrobia bacterium]|nr:CBS domain-containing protein [Elusimicrobiota bacterium]MDE2425173.1 CBS domain-containing protein [Elusimicrobiota bacterium]
MIAADIMRKEVVTVYENQTVEELERLLLDHRITGVPVVDERKRLVGVISQTDLVRRDREANGKAEPAAYHQELDRRLGRQGFRVETPSYTRVREVMTPAVLSAEAKTPVSELARCMTEKHVHRIVITDKGKLAGIVTSMDILRAFIKLAEEAK